MPAFLANPQNSWFNVYHEARGGFGFVNIADQNGHGDNVFDDSIPLQAAAAQVASGGGVLFIPTGTFRIAQNTTIPSNVTLAMMPGAKFSIDSGKTLTINGKLDAGLNQIFTGSGSVTFNALVSEIYPQWWGATGDGTTDDTTAINKAIAAANRTTLATYGVTIFFPAGDYNTTAQLTTPGKFVRLLGASGWVRNSSSGGVNTTRIKTTLTTSSMFDLGTSVTSNVIFENLCLRGDASGSKDAHGVLIPNAASCVFHRVRIENFGGSAIKWQAGGGLYIRDFMSDGCLQDRANLTAHQGVVDIAGPEATIEEAEVAGGLLAGTHGAGGSGYACAIVVRSSPHRFHKVVAEFGQTGVYFTTGIGGDYIFVTDCRSEFNQREGWLVDGKKVNFVNCSAMNNSQDTDNTYDGWSFTNAAGQNRLVGCVVGGTSSNPYKQRYGFTDAVNAVAADLKNCNHYIDCGAPFNVNGRVFNITGASKPSISPSPMQQGLTGTGTQTFDCEGGDLFYLNVNANVATTLDCTNLVRGKIITITIFNASGAAPAITLAAKFRSSGYVAPANNKFRTCQYYIRDTDLIQIGQWSPDL